MTAMHQCPMGSCHTAASAAGLVRGSAPLSFLQWFGRSNVLFLVLHSIPEVRAPARHPARCTATIELLTVVELNDATWAWAIAGLQLWTHWAVPVLFIAWALADLARYPFYAASLVGRPPGLLTWLR